MVVHLLQPDVEGEGPLRAPGTFTVTSNRLAIVSGAHGGALMAMADTFGGACAYLNLPPGTATSTIESKTNFFGAVRKGRVESVPLPLRVERTTITVQTDLFDGGGRRIAQTTQAILGGTSG